MNQKNKSGEIWENLNIIKLGGSVITDKSIPFRARKGDIDRLAREIAGILPEIDYRLIIVHGGGSYGHPVAAKYKIKEGICEGDFSPFLRQRLGFAQTKKAMIELNSIIVDSFLRADVPVVPIPPSAISITKNERISSFDTAALYRALKGGFIPLLHGDPVFDEEKGFTILSGDQIVSYLARIMGVERVLIGTDVDGLYTEDPKINPDAKPVDILKYSQDYETVLAKLTRDKQRVKVEKIFIDVTDQMIGKISEIIDIWKRGIEIIIFNARKPNYLTRIFRNEKVPCTRLID